MKPAPLAIRRPKLVLIAWAAVMCLMSFVLVVFPQIDINPTLKSMIMANDPDRGFDTNFKERLGDDEMIVIAVENPQGVFDIPTLTYIDQITSEIEKLPAVRKVYSLTRADDIRGRGGVIVADDLITTLPKTRDDLALIEKETFDNPLFANMIVSRDKKVAGVNVELRAGHTTDADAETSKAVYDIIDAAESLKPAGVKAYVSGFPVASYLGGNYMIIDMVIFSFGACVVLVIIIWLVLRSWHGVAFTMFVSMSAVCATFGVMTLAGVKITMPLSSIMPLTMAIGMEYSVYVAFAYQHETHAGAHGRDRREPLRNAVLDVRFTVAMSAMCAAAAFGSMLTNPLDDLKLLGGFLAFGALVCGLASITIIPAWISLWGYPVPPAKDMKHKALQRLIDAVGRWDVRRPWHVLAMLVVICGVGVFLWTKLSYDSDAFQWFRNSSKIYQDDRFIRNRMAGDVIIPVVVSGTVVDTFKDPANLRKLDEISRYAETLPHVTKVISHADHIKLLNEALKSGEPSDYQLPDTKEAVAQYLLLHNEPDDFHLWIDSDYREAAVMVRMDTMSSTTLRDTDEKLKAFAHKQFPTMDDRAVGTTLLVHRAFDSMATSLLTGMGVTTLCILIIMVIGFRSLKIGLIAMIPTLPPAIMVYATLPILGKPLDPPTGIIGAIALGIAIDDTTWFLRTWVAWRRKPGIDGGMAVTKTLTQIGRPMILSSMVLGLGFTVMVLSRYLALFWIGMMMTITAFWSIFWDVLCTPTIIHLFDPKLPKQRGEYDAAKEIPEAPETPPKDEPAP